MQWQCPSHSLQPQLIPSAPGPHPRHPPQQQLHRDLQLTCPGPGSQPCGRTSRRRWQTRCLSGERGRALAVPTQLAPKRAQGERLRAAQRQPDRPAVRAPIAPSVKTGVCELGYLCWGAPCTRLGCFQEAPLSRSTARMAQDRQTRREGAAQLGSSHLCSLRCRQRSRGTTAALDPNSPS